VSYFIAFITALIAAVVITPLLVETAVRVDILDRPGGRKIHPMAVPRLGGVSLAFGLVVALAASLVADAQGVGDIGADPGVMVPVLTGGLLVFVAGLWDDIDPRTPAFKLMLELAACGVIVGSGIVISSVTLFGVTHQLGWGAPVLTVLWLLVITNAFNLLDGLDGLAGGLIAIAAATCAIMLIARGEAPAARMLLALVGAVIGFLVFNLHPAKIFLGDSGSLLAGFLLAATAVVGQQKEATTLAAAVPLMIFALPIAETFHTVLRRVYAGQRESAPGLPSRLRALSLVFAPDTGHLHHRLGRLGLPPTVAVLLLYLISCVFSALALLTMEAR
jgi:UDP-GlcNAc:undecaprenyl-phosphate GlcNAc-1-phosphate transferase